MRKAVFPGSFDPVTMGHVNIIERASCLFGEVVIAVAEVSSKQMLWDLSQRTQMMKAAVSHLPNVRVEAFSGLLVDFLKAQHIPLLVRGVRSLMDWNYEHEMSLLNQKLWAEVETIYLSAHSEHTVMSSTFVRQVWKLGGDLSNLVPAPVLKLMHHFAS
jgi:pantetheine-phosphate adenylyltransferase